MGGGAGRGMWGGAGVCEGGKGRGWRFAWIHERVGVWGWGCTGESMTGWEGGCMEESMRGCDSGWVGGCMGRSTRDEKVTRLFRCE